MILWGYAMVFIQYWEPQNLVNAILFWLILDLFSFYPFTVISKQLSGMVFITEFAQKSYEIGTPREVYHLSISSTL